MKFYVGNDPRVNKVCFCFPFPFFPPLGPACILSPSTAPFAAAESPPSTLAFAFPPAPAPPAAQAVTAGLPDAPKIFFNDTFPFTCGKFALELADVGNSGNREFDSFGGACFGPERPPAFAFIAGPDEETAAACVRRAGGVAALADHGVARCPGRGAVDDDDDPPPPREGNRSWTGLLGAAVDVGGGRKSSSIPGELPPDELAASATRFHTCWDWEERMAVECLAFKTRPDAIPE